MLDKKMFNKHNDKQIQELINVSSNPIARKRPQSADNINVNSKKLSSPIEIMENFNKLGKEIAEFEKNNKRQDRNMSKNCKKFSKSFIKIGNEINSKSTINLNLKSVIESIQTIDKEILALNVIQDYRSDQNLNGYNNISTNNLNNNQLTTSLKST